MRSKARKVEQIKIEVMTIKFLKGELEELLVAPLSLPESISLLCISHALISDSKSERSKFN